MEKWLTNWFVKESARDKTSDQIQILTREFYERHTLDVSVDLLGKILLVRSNSQYSWDDPRAEIAAGRIVETEAYRGDDPASHSCRGKTPRCSMMFGNPGVAYVYFIYGMYEMLNFVTEPAGFPGAVLIRALEPLVGLEWMHQRRNKKSVRDLTSGPGRLCQALSIEMSHNGESLSGPALYVLDDGSVPQRISQSPRVGITQATEKYWRFFITDSLFISKAPQNATSQPFTKE